MKRYALVYQNGIANVFEVTGPMNQYHDARGKTRGLLQSSFEACYWYAKGIAATGAEVFTYACPALGSIVDADWSTPLDEAPFADKIRVA